MTDFIKGRGAQHNPNNSFLRNKYAPHHVEGIDEWESGEVKTSFTSVYPKSIVNKVTSPDVGMMYSANPYQGCEHGCIYCYARNSHEYWGFSAGLDFESKILVKENAPKLFRDFITKRNWDGSTISLSGNTDCYQPAERKYKLTRQILEIALQHGQPVALITKNSLIQRDIDVLRQMADKNLCMVYFSINSLTEETRQKLEPRTATAEQRFKTMKLLAEQGIPVGIMCAPVIPGLTDHEIPNVLRRAQESGAKQAGYTIVRLNGQIGAVFENWLYKAYPERAQKIWHRIQDCHEGKVNDSVYGNRIKGTGKIAQIIEDTFKLQCKLHQLNQEKIVLSNAHFRTNTSIQLSLF